MWAKRPAELVVKAWRGEIPAANQHGGDRRPPEQDSATVLLGSTERADGILARLKRDHPDLGRH